MSCPYCGKYDGTALWDQTPEDERCDWSCAERCEVEGHAWGDIQNGWQWCDRCSAKRRITDAEAVEFIWGARA